jgi:hypothetical protein
MQIELWYFVLYRDSMVQFFDALLRALMAGSCLMLLLSSYSMQSDIRNSRLVQPCDFSVLGEKAFQFHHRLVAKKRYP